MDIASYVILGALVFVVLFYVIIKIVSVAKLSPEEKKKMLLTYLKGLVAFAEREFGSGKGQEKMQEVENFFEHKAPVVYKIALLILGKENLKQFIEEALKEIKEDFKEN